MGVFEDISILHEDEQVLLINKPIGLVVTAGAGNPEEKTLVGWLINRYGEGLREVGSGVQRPGIVHRLDKDTSGVMAVAKTQMAFEMLVNQFKKRQAKKEYLAMSWGDVGKKLKIQNPKSKIITEGFKSIGVVSIGNFEIDAPIGRNPHWRTKFAVVRGAKPAVTKGELVKVIQFGEKLVSAMRLFPLTGRTHQLRVHLAAWGYPILGDVLYQGRAYGSKWHSFAKENELTDRLYLHAHRLEITMPDSGKPKEFVAPVPASMENVIF